MCFYPKQSVNISSIPATIKGKHQCLKCPIKSPQVKHWSGPGSFHRRPLSPLKWGSLAVVLTVFLDTSVTYDKDGTWLWWCLRAEGQPNMFAYFAPAQRECCAEWEEHATSQSLPSVSPDPGLKKIYGLSSDVISCSYISVAIISIVNIVTSEHLCKDVCVSAPVVASNCGIFTFWDFRRPASSKISFTRLLYPCSNISRPLVLAALIIVSKQVDSYCANNGAHQGIPSENPTVLYLLSNKFFIARLLSFIPFTLQTLTEDGVHLE